MNVPLPLKFKGPTDDFDGTTGPIDHILIFQDRARLHSWPDAIACRLFPMTLRKEAIEWFNTLPPWSISSFSDFKNKFAICLSSSAREKRCLWDLCRFGQSITYNDEELEGVSFLHDDALVITSDIANFDVKQVLIDTRSAANVLSWKAFKVLKIPTDRLIFVNIHLQGFRGGTVIPKGIIDLSIVLGKQLIV
ncbi:Integrase catalytic domain-containing protein [Abeliophyllum distichum]|uniref:Integrase catalytic domain-containing protein n=1 Tax=Abeliophyllum distichum TaxID=126358 RepID=A0ABD1V6R9_9LAMI